MTVLQKRAMMLGIAGIAFLSFLYFANLSVFFVWQSAFTHANVPSLKVHFYLNAALALVSISVSIFFLWKGIRFRTKR